MAAATPPLDQRFPFKDRTGYMLGEGCFVKVERPCPVLRGRTIEFRGLVTGRQSDKKGDYLVIAEWSGGSFTGNTRYARPGQCEVRRAPKNLRAEEASAARRAAALKEIR
jgi:hypothetical protein